MLSNSVIVSVAICGPQPIVRSPLAHQITVVPLHFPLHPTQRYEAALVLLSNPLLLWLRKRKAFAGGVTLVYALYYAVVRFLLEFFCGDPRGYYFSGFLSTSQLINLVIIPAAVFLLLRLREHANFAKQSNHRPSRALVLRKARTKAI